MKSKKILIIMLSFIMIISFIVPSYALTDYSEYCRSTPSDLGYSLTNGYIGLYNNMVTKIYVRIQIQDITNNSVYMNYFYKNDNDEEIEVLNTYFLNLNNGKLSITYYANNINGINITYPVFNVDVSVGDVFYIPIYIYNITKLKLNNNIIGNGIRFTFYSSVTLEQQQLINEAYEIGYNNGYTNGVADRSDYENQLNFVTNINMLIASFVGDTYAQYVTPIAIILAILLVYFIFIRFLLSLIKAKGVIKVCDIVTLVACISILMVMYIPMIDFTITQHQLVEQVYSVAADVTP